MAFRDGDYELDTDDYDEDYEEIVDENSNKSKSSSEKKISNNDATMNEIGYCKSGKSARGCKLCIEGQKLVLFITGVCGQKCFYCPVSEKKFGKDEVYANEWKIEKIDDLYEEISVIENLRYYGRLYNVSESNIKANSKKLLDFMKLSGSENVLAKNLSGGMKRRLDFACAMIHNPKILIMDEPTTGLDPVLRKEFWKLIRYIKSSGRTIIFSSHLLSELEGLCEKVAIVDNGTIVAFGNMNEIKDKFSRNAEIHLETIPGDYKRIAANLKQGKNIEKLVVYKHKMVCFVRDPHIAIKELVPLVEQLGERITDLDINKPTLTEVFEFYMETDN